MKKSYLLLLPLVCSTPVLLGCSSLTEPHEAASGALHIEPVLSIRNSDSGARGFYQLGRYLQGQNRLQQAADAYRNALALQADYIDAQNALGAIYSAQGKFDQAIAEFSAILKKNPKLAHVHNNLGYTFYLEGHYADAVAAFEDAIALEPNNPRALNNLLLAQKKLGAPERPQLALADAAVLDLPKVPPEAANTSSAEEARLPALTSGESVRLEAPTQGASVALDTTTQTATGTSIVDTAQNVVAPVVTLLAAAADRLDQAFETMASATLQVLSVTPVSNAMFSVRSLSEDGSEIPPGKAFNFEIANGNGIADLAKKVADTLTHDGLPTPRLSNLKPYQQSRTVIRYRDGFYFDAARVGSKLSEAPLIVLDPQLRKNTDVLLVLGKDAISQVAMFGPDSRKTVLPNHRSATHVSNPVTVSDIMAASTPQGF